MKNLKKQESDYKVRQSVKGLGKASVISAVLSFFFYRNVWAMIPMMLPACLYVWWEQKKEYAEKKEMLLRQFGECILSVGNSVRSGYAVENAFVESIEDMKMMYGPEADILNELIILKGGLCNHIPIENLLEEMGRRTTLQEVCEFAEIFKIAKKSGGNTADVISMTAEMINNRMNLKEDIYTIQAAGRLEQKIMNLVPLGLLLYMELTTPGYFDMYYANMQGRLLMTLFLVWYIGAYGFSEMILWNEGCV